MAHTPGPWVASHYLDTNEIGVISHTNRIVVGLSSRLTEDNARLIAAAPRMLQKLDDVWNFLDAQAKATQNGGAKFHMSLIAAEVKKVIDEATGGA